MRVAVTGATSDFGTAILPVLLDDPEIDGVLGLGRRPLRSSHPKLESVRMDIRDPKIEEVFRGCDAVVHLAFVVEEIRDKSITHDINLRGSRNVIDSAARAGVRRVVIASSINAYGPDLHPEPVDESVYPAGDPVRYYFHDKAEVEHYAEWWMQRHPGEMFISMLRPTYIVGPDFSNDGIDQLTGSVGAFPQADVAAYQFLHQRDMADAFHRATKQDLVGPFNLGPREWVPVRELAAMQGQKMFSVPEKPAIAIANLAFKLRLTPFSGQWVTAGEVVVDSTRLSEATGWAPTLTAREAAAVMILLQGKALLRADAVPSRHVACELAIEPASAFVGIDGRDVEHVQLPVEGGSVHLEVHDGVTAGGTVVIPAPIGLHARYLTSVATELVTHGVNVVLVDLPGHGLSTGRRGHALAGPVSLALIAAEDFARRRFGGVPRTVRFGPPEPAHTSFLPAVSRRIRPVNPDDGLLPRRVRHDGGLAELTAVGSVREAVDIVAGARLEA
ncbi:NAD-dependent epimerase/dehydratase family protein [Rhodococcus sp. NPDC058521]|uniref:NAD-dependent epimerase/dehydratase family protein n=1 Tax=Rhodococcus sp. NPDC058521 TaxID=3346536 RepID=UPI00365609EC